MHKCCSQHLNCVCTHDWYMFRVRNDTKKYKNRLKIWQINGRILTGTTVYSDFAEQHTVCSLVWWRACSQTAGGLGYDPSRDAGRAAEGRVTSSLARCGMLLCSATLTTTTRPAAEAGHHRITATPTQNSRLHLHVNIMFHLSSGDFCVAKCTARCRQLFMCVRVNNKRQ